MENNVSIKSKNNLSKEEIERYCRQIILPEIGPDGQEKINKARVLVVGAGGLGSPCLMYLAGAGVGEIGIIDGDSVDTSNLHRQIIHSTINKGVNKAKSAEMLIKSFNPLTKVNTYHEHFTNKNALLIAKNYDLLIDCCDNPATRYLTNDVCVVLNIPLVSGSAVKWEGQLTVYVKNSLKSDDDDSNKLPCYRCLFPLPTPASSVCNCGDSGVFGPVPGVIGTLQANEAVKLILGASDKILSKRMLNYDAYEMTFKIFKLRNSKDDCIVCGKEEKRKITIDNLESFDYDDFTNPKDCRIEKRLKLPEENCKKWKDLINYINSNSNNNSNNGIMDELVLIDVRPKEQFDMFSIDLIENLKFVNIPYVELLHNYEIYEKLFRDVENFNNSISSRKEVYFSCRAGNQSTHAVNLLLKKGFKNVYNLEDGIHGYIRDVDSNNTPFY